MPDEVVSGDALKRRLSVLDGGRVLDVATGAGAFARTLATGLRSYDEIIGIDTSDETLATAREMKLERVKFETMDAMKLGFEDASFDTVAVSNSLHHLASPGAVLHGMKRVLKPGGLFIVQEMFRDGQNETQMSHVLFHTFRSEIDTMKGITHRRSYLRQELVNTYRGLELEGLDLFDYGPDDMDPKPEPEDKAEIDHLAKMIDQMLAHPADYRHDQSFKVRGQEVKDYIREHGFLRATVLVGIGRKLA